MLGDTPYGEGEVRRLDALIEDLNGENLDFVVHVGDLGTSSEACTDAWIEARERQLKRIRAPLVVIPGDNEWSDCRDQQERLAAWRQLYCPLAFPAVRQPGEYCEHLRWQAAGLIFVTLNVAGSNNNMRRDSQETARRMRAALAWLDEAAALAERRKQQLVVLLHANPFIVLPRDGYAPLRERLVAIAARLPGRLYLIHGDTHFYHDDEPLPGVRRLEVWGSPLVSWVRAELEGGELRFRAPRYR